MKKNYHQPHMSVAEMLPTCGILSLSAEMPGYKADTGGGFSQDERNTKSNKQHYDVWEEWK